MKAFSPLLSCKNLSMHFPVKSGFLRRRIGERKAVDDVSFEIGEKEIVGVIGESGSGKTTLAKMIVRLLRPTDGQLFFDSVDITHATEEELRPLRKSFQIVFQNPASSLNPRMRIKDTLEEVVLFHQMADNPTAYIQSLMRKVGLDLELLSRYPHELSIGQQQRVSIARSLITQPRLLVLDECVSALDISVQAQVLNLLLELYEEYGMSYLFISHDIRVVEHLADKVIVMKDGKIVEEGLCLEVLENPQHPYTKLLLSAELPI